MTAATYRSTNATLPPTQNAAPVLEFRCLYTFDVRRKNQKRWQDGFLRFHTFNKRIMVYDVPRNFIGDTHWKESWDLQEGDEVALEKGILVQVEDPVATTETDLTPLFEKKAKRPLVGSAIEAGTRPSGAPVKSMVSRNISQSRDKPLTALLGTPKGAYGRALLPTRSPYEERLNAQAEWNKDRPAKRQRTGITPSGPRATHSTVNSNTTPLWVKTSEAQTRRNITTPLPNRTISNVPSGQAAKEVVDVDSDYEHDFMSDVTLPETPEFARSVRSIRRTRPLKTPSRPANAIASSPISVSNEITNVQKIADEERCMKESAKPPLPEFVPVRHQTKALKLSTASHARATLLCQQPSKTKSLDPGKKSPTESVPRDRNPRPERSLGRDVSSLQDPSHMNQTKDSGPSERHSRKPGKRLNSPIVIEGSDNEDHNQGSEQPKIDAPTKPPRRLRVDGKSLAETIRKTAISSNLADQAEPSGIREMAPVHGRLDQPLPSKPSTRASEISHMEIGNQHAPRRFRRVQSEIGAPPELQDNNTSESRDGLSVPHPRRQMRRTKSLLIEKSTDKVVEPPPPVVDTDVGPWSTEAFDLFEWRPPDINGKGKGGSA